MGQVPCQILERLTNVTNCKQVAYLRNMVVLATYQEKLFIPWTLPIHFAF
jgi:hypothetical protein